jgi:hypothetical protein
VEGWAALGRLREGARIKEIGRGAGAVLEEIARGVGVEVGA